MSENLLGHTGDGVGFRICNFTKKDYVASALLWILQNFWETFL